MADSERTEALKMARRANVKVKRGATTEEIQDAITHMLNLYAVTRTDSGDYQETDAYVVAATTEQDARDFGDDVRGDQPASIWRDPATKVTLLGQADPSMTAGIVLGSYNAG